VLWRRRPLGWRACTGAPSPSSARALWNVREFEHPTVKQALAITRQLRTEGDMHARRLAEQIEEAARAHL
jgi:hypothetical protein